jgi:hypothetical protein
MAISSTDCAGPNHMSQDGSHNDITANQSAPLSPLSILNAARKAVPAVDYALGAAGVAAAAAIIVAILGNGRAAFIILGAMLVAMILLFVFARLVTAQSPAVTQAGTVLLWMVIVFFGTFLFFTATAVAIDWPRAMVRLLGLSPEVKFDKAAMQKLLEVPKEVSNRIAAIQPPIDIVRLQVRPSDFAILSAREAVLSGGGAYYSFLRRKHEFGSGSDILLWPGQFKTAIADNDYGFLLYAGQGTPDELVKLNRGTPPAWLDPNRGDAWKFMWDYRPPTDMKAIKAEKKKFLGFVVAGTTFSDSVAVRNGGVYLLRSILIDRSDILVSLYVADVLDDESVVFAWRILYNFDTPAAVVKEN